MQVYDTCRAGAIQLVRIGRSEVPAKQPSENTLKAKRDFYPDKDADHRDRLNAIANDKTLTAEQRNARIAEENDAFNADQTVPKEPDENQDGIADEQQDIIHFTLAGGEKRSILRSDLKFSPVVADRNVDGFPVYAQKKPVMNAGIKPLEEDRPIAPTNETVHDQGAVQPVPVTGDYLVEYFDPVTDTFVQKVYDAVTFVRYFKASLN